MNALIFQAVAIYFGAREVPFAQVARITDAIVHVVETEQQLPFRGRHAMERTGLLLAALANHESGLRQEIEYCTFKHAPGLTEDDGRAVGYTQLFKGPSWDGHAREEICGDAELQFRLALRYLAWSERKCGSVGGALSNFNRNVCQPTVYSERLAISYRRVAARLGVRP